MISITGILAISNGEGGFLHVFSPEGDVVKIYIESAVIYRYRLRDGDHITAQIRPPRGNEHFSSVLKVESINGQKL